LFDNIIFYLKKYLTKNFLKKSQKTQWITWKNLPLSEISFDIFV
jgi:hypothetical protein